MECQQFRAFSASQISSTSYLGRCPRLLHHAPLALSDGHSESQGKTKEEALENIREPIDLYLSPNQRFHIVILRFLDRE
jgi:hypothetical protein